MERKHRCCGHFSVASLQNEQAVKPSSFARYLTRGLSVQVTGICPQVPVHCLYKPFIRTLVIHMSLAFATHKAMASANNTAIYLQ